MPLITDNQSLIALCEKFASHDYIAVDTEFLRDKTYYPKLCLVQIATPDAHGLIDPLVGDLDLAPVFALMANPKITKVFHACRQDIEIFYQINGTIPTPIFDTQVAASVLGHGESASYETLVNKIAGKEIDKSSRFTDWTARPLSDAQRAYALSDVTHLCTIYEKLRADIKAKNRAEWIAEEHAYLTNPALYELDPRDAYKRLKYGTMRPKHLVILRELAAWRETEAREANVPRGRIVKDEQLIEIALAAPKKEADIRKLRSMEHALNPKKIEAVLRCVETALALPASEFPKSKEQRKLPEHVGGAVAMLQLLLKVKADEHGLAASLIAGKDELEALVLGFSENPVLSGWRRDIFGEAAEKLLSGKLTLSLDAKSKHVVFGEKTAL